LQKSEMKEEFTLTGSGTGLGLNMAEQAWGEKWTHERYLFFGNRSLRTRNWSQTLYSDTPMAVVLKHMMTHCRDHVSILPIADRERVLFACKDPQDRYSKISEFADALENINHANCQHQPNTPTSSTNLTQLLQQKTSIGCGRTRIVGIVFAGVLTGCWRGDKQQNLLPRHHPPHQYKYNDPFRHSVLQQRTFPTATQIGYWINDDRQRWHDPALVACR
jgi:hypothetical protein